MKVFVIAIISCGYVLSFCGCGDSNETTHGNYEKENFDTIDESPQSIEYTESEEESDNDYFSVIESTANGGLRFNMTIDEFVESYNQLVKKDYRISVSDFKYNKSDVNINGVQVDQYYCTKSVFENNNKVNIVLYVEVDSNCIANAQVLLPRDLYLLMSEDDKSTLSVQCMFVVRALIEEIESTEDYFTQIHKKQSENNELYGEPSVYLNGVLFSYNTIDNTSMFDFRAYSEEQYKNYIRNIDME